MRLRSLLVAGLSALIVLISAGPPVNLVSARSVATDSAFIEVPLYTQQRNLSCEYASLVIAMGAYDTWVSEWTFDDLVPLSDNPHWGYRGDINGSWGNTTDYGVYPEALVRPLAELGFRGEVFYAEGDASSLQRYLANGVPVILWLGMQGDQSYYEYASDGTPYKINPGYHVVVAYGYDETGVYASDPATGSTVSWSWGDLMWMWNTMDGMSLAVWPLARTETMATDAPSDLAASDPTPGVCC
jgi:uncharacterized protein YvpB